MIKQKSVAYNNHTSFLKFAVAFFTVKYRKIQQNNSSTLATMALLMQCMFVRHCQNTRRVCFDVCCVSEAPVHTASFSCKN